VSTPLFPRVRPRSFGKHYHAAGARHV